MQSTHSFVGHAYVSGTGVGANDSENTHTLFLHAAREGFSHGLQAMNVSHVLVSAFFLLEPYSVHPSFPISCLFMAFGHAQHVFDWIPVVQSASVLQDSGSL